MNSRNLVLASAFAAGLLSLVGCAGKTRYPSYYVLKMPVPVPASMPSAPILGTVAVREFRAPAFLTGGPIVYRPSREQGDFYNYHHFAEATRKIVPTPLL